MPGSEISLDAYASDKLSGISKSKTLLLVIIFVFR